MKDSFISGNRTGFICIALFQFMLIMTLSSCGGEVDGGTKESILVTTSWLECCVRDIAGDDAEIISLCPPGTCPGHFDLKPGDVERVRACRLVFRFDFQESLDAKLAGNGAGVKVVKAPEGLCVPSGYLMSCRGICADLKEINSEKTEFYNRRLNNTASQMRKLEEEIDGIIAANNLGDVKVIASGHQAAFCRWLGLDLVAAYSGPQSASPRGLEDIVMKGKDVGVTFVIANLQEGSQVGEALAYHLGAKLVVFSNFPDMSSGQSKYQDLVRENVERLVTAAAD